MTKSIKFETQNEECLWQDIVRDSISGGLHWANSVDYADAVIQAFRKRVPEEYER